MTAMTQAAGAANSARKVARLVVRGAMLLLLACSQDPISPEPDVELVPAASRSVTIDFSTAGFGVFDPDFYRDQGIVFPPERCGPEGCGPWFVELIQGDSALGAGPRLGPVTARFTRPVSTLSLAVAPALQGTASYTLTAFAASGKLVASTSVTVTQDTGDPADTGPGYFTINLTDLPRPARSFTLENAFVRSSFPVNTEIDYGVSEVSFTRWGGRSK